MDKKKSNDQKPELEQLQARVDELENQLKRAVADYHNLEKRIAEGRSELSNWATVELIKKIVPVLDHFEKVLTGVSEEEKQSAWFKGVELAVQQLQGVLKDEGLEEIGADGQFDPALHEAVDVKESASSSTGEIKDNMILEVVEKGYNLNGKVVKPAKVIVGRQSS